MNTTKTSVKTRAKGERPLTPAGRRVLEVAGDLFYRQGINSVGMELVAEEAGVTKKTIYDRFGSKEALVAAYLRARDARWRAWLTGYLDRHAGDDPRARILATFDGLGTWVREQNPRGCGFVNAYAELSDPNHPGRVVAHDQKAWEHDQFAAQAEQAGLRDPGGLAAALFMLHEGAIIAFAVAGRDDAFDHARAAATVLVDAAAGSV